MPPTDPTAALRTALEQLQKDVADLRIDDHSSGHMLNGFYRCRVLVLGLIEQALVSQADDPSGPCWFCKGRFPVGALIAGYDTFDEQRLACLACNERMQGNWRADDPSGPDVAMGHIDGAHNHEADPVCRICGTALRLWPQTAAIRAEKP